MAQFGVIVSGISYHTFAVEAPTMDEARLIASTLWDSVTHQTEVQVVDSWKVEE